MGKRIALAGIALVCVGIVHVAARPGFSGPQLARAIAQFQAGRFSLASALLEQYVRAFPEDPNGLLWLGASYYFQGRYPEASRAFYRAATLRPTEYSYLWLGATYARMRRGEEAEKLLGWLARHASDRQVRAIALAWERAAVAVAQLPPSPVPEAYARVVRRYNPALPPHLVDLIVRSVLYYSWQYGVDPRLVMALIAVESGFQIHARSPAGAYGLGQLMPATWQALRINPADPISNIYGTVRVLRGHLDRYGHTNLPLALAAYNAGRGAVTRYGGVPPFAETQWYVYNVQALYVRFTGGSPQVSRKEPIDT